MVTCNIGKTGLTRNHIAGSIPESNFDSEMTVGTRDHSRPALRSLRSLRAVRSFCQPSAGRLDGQRVDLWHSEVKDICAKEIMQCGLNLIYGYSIYKDVLRSNYS